MVSYKLENEKQITERILFFTEQVNQASISKISEKIIHFNEIDDEAERYAEFSNITYERETIKIYIDSYGGNVYQILGLISIIEKSKTPIHTYVTGCAMSCGFLLLISGHKRFSYKYSTALYHQVSSAAWGKLQDIEEDVKETQRLQEIIERITLDKTKISKSRLKESKKLKEDWFIPADELVDYGIVDEIL